MDARAYVRYDQREIKNMNGNEKLFLGIELGSTRIKAQLTDAEHNVISSGGYDWENSYEDGYWTYPLEAAREGLQACYAGLRKDYESKTGKKLTSVTAMGVSAMMHGYLVFDREMRQPTPFRTWRNARAKEASDTLTELFGFHVPQRWSAANYFQSMLEKQPHVPGVAYLTTLSGYIHFLLTGRNEVGLCEASGMFPVSGGEYDPVMASKFNEAAAKLGYEQDIVSILPKIRPAGAKGAYLTAEGARFLDPTGTLLPGIPVCPPEGDAGTGMAATASVRPGTGSVSAGTSVFALLTLQKPLDRVFREIDSVKTPDGADTALIHSCNGCTELDNWVGVFGEFARMLGENPGKTELYSMLYNNAKNADPDCGGVTAYNFIAAEPIAGVRAGIPALYRPFDGRLSLANLFRAELCAAVAGLRIGMKILSDGGVAAPSRLNAHGGLFKIPGVAQQILADAVRVPVTVLSSAGEGGAWGMSLLAAYMTEGAGQMLADWLDRDVFSRARSSTLYPDPKGAEGFDAFMKNYENGLRLLRQI